MLANPNILCLLLGHDSLCLSGLVGSGSSWQCLRKRQGWLMPLVCLRPLSNLGLLCLTVRLTREGFKEKESFNLGSKETR